MRIRHGPPPEDEPSPPEPPVEQQELDLTTGTTAEPPPPNRLVRPRTESYNPEPARERIRGVLAVGLFLLIALLAGGSYALLAIKRLSKDDMDALNPIFASLATLTGTAIGFYFGGGRNGGRNGGAGSA